MILCSPAWPTAAVAPSPIWEDFMSVILQKYSNCSRHCLFFMGQGLIIEALSQTNKSNQTKPIPSEITQETKTTE